MSENSCLSALQTAPIVIALPPRAAGSGAGMSGSSMGGSWVRVAIMASLVEVGELVLADLDLVAVLEAARVHALAGGVGAGWRGAGGGGGGGGPADDDGAGARH